VLARDVDRFVAVSAELATAIRANRIRVDRTIHNAIRADAHKPSDAEIAAFRRRFGLEGKRVLTIAGRLHEQKGVVQLLEVLARLAAEFRISAFSRWGGPRPGSGSSRRRRARSPSSRAS
jgi:glycosyltransferase involved in cell wall biosynthesis